MSKKRAILIAGPTASGKSAVALALAKAIDGAVINADSMQVYQELRVLSARPSEQDEAQVSHTLYGFVPAAQAYSVGRWLTDVQRAIAETEACGKVPIITGGTGLYFKVLLEGLSPIPDVPEDVREHWRGMAAEMSSEALYAILSERDPDMAARLELSDTQRLVRALEVLDATGASLAQWQQEAGEAMLKNDEVVRIYITRPREELYRRINARFDTMLEEGALDEVRALAELNLGPDLPAMRALGVQPLKDQISGIITHEEAAEQVKMQTRRYAKRQETWARSNMITWKSISTQDSESLMSNIFSFIDV